MWTRRELKEQAKDALIVVRQHDPYLFHALSPFSTDDDSGIYAKFARLSTVSHAPMRRGFAPICRRNAVRVNKRAKNTCNPGKIAV